MIHCNIKSQHFRHNTRICFWPQLPALQAMCLLSTAPVRPTFILPCSKTLRRKQNTRQMRSRGYCWEPRQWCQRASKGHNPGTGTSGPQDEAQDSAEDRKQIHSAPGAKPTQRRLQSGRSVWQMPFKRVIKDGFMWSVCTKPVNYLGPVAVIGFQSAYLGWGTALQHAAELSGRFSLKRSDNNCKLLPDAKDNAGSNLNDVVTLILVHLNAHWLKHGAVASSSLARYTNFPLLNALCYFQSLTVINCTILPLSFQPFSMLPWIHL